MVAEVKLIARAQNGQTQTFQYKPGDKHAAQGKTIYKLVVDGSEKLPPGTKISRKGSNLFIEFADGQTFEITDWCGMGESKLIDLEGSEALVVNTGYVSANEIESGACIVAGPGNESAGTLGEAGTGAASAPPPSGGMSPGAIGGIIGVVALLGAAGGGGGGGGGGDGGGGGSKPATPSSIPDLTTASDSGLSATDDNTNDNTPSITIPAPGSGETPSLYLDGTKVDATFDPATNTLTPTIPLTDGPHTITYTLTNANGESEQSPALAIVIDTEAPTAVPAAAPDMTDATDTGSSASDDLTRNSRPSFVVEAPPAGLTPVLIIDGTVVPSVFDAATNTLTPIDSIPPGAHIISTALQDTAGNIGPASTAVLNIVIAPVAALDPASDSGVPGDGITSDRTPSIQGFGTPGDTVTVTFPGGEVKTVTITNPDGSWQVTPSNPLPEGLNVIEIVARDPGGNITSSTNLAVTIDTATSAVPSIVDVPENTSNGTINSSEAADGTTVQVAIPTDVQAGDVLTLNVGGVVVQYTIQPADIAAIATVPISPAVLASLSDGIIPVTAFITDAAGNASASSAASSITLDRTAPAAPSILSVPENVGGINAAEDDDGVTVNVALPGSAVAGDTLTVFLNGVPTAVVLSTTDISNGTVPVTILVGSLPASDGAYTLTSTLTDQSGNVSAVSSGFDITLDRGAPSTPAIAPDMTAATDSGANSDDVTNDPTPSFTIPAPGSGRDAEPVCRRRQSRRHVRRAHQHLNAH